MIDLFFKNNNYRPLSTKHCPGILSCSSKTRNPLKISTLPSKKGTPSFKNTS